MAQRHEGSSHKVYVRSTPPLPDDVTDKQLKHHFRKLKVKWALVERTRAGKSKGYGTVAFYSQDEAEESISLMNGSMFLSGFQLTLQLKSPQQGTQIEASTSMALIVENIRPTVTEDDIRSLLTVSIDAISLRFDSTQRSMCACIHVSNPEEIGIAVKCFNEKKIDGQIVRAFTCTDNFLLKQKFKTSLEKRPCVPHEEDRCMIEEKLSPQASNQPSLLHSTNVNRASLFVVVKNIAPKVTKQDLLSLFQTEQSNPILCGFNSSKHAYVEFQSSDEASFAITHFQRTLLMERRLSVSLLKSIHDLPAHIRNSSSRRKPAEMSKYSKQTTDQKAALNRSSGTSKDVIFKRGRDISAFSKTKDTSSDKTVSTHRGTSMEAKPTGRKRRCLGDDSEARQKSEYFMEASAVRRSHSKLTKSTCKPRAYLPGTVAMKPKNTADKQAMILYITTSMNRVGYKSSLSRLLGSRFNFKILSVQINETRTRAEVQFDDAKSANCALKEIRESSTPGIEVSLSKYGIVTSPELSVIIDELKDILSNAEGRDNYVSKCKILNSLNKKMNTLIVPKGASLDKCIAIESEQELLRAEILECELQLREFKTYCESLGKNLDHWLLEVPSSSNGKSQLERVSQMKRDFNRECVLFDKGLPIYAYRSCIIDVIRLNQVTILIGETGSGKSTQLVQYLYDAGFATNGVIVCTQPRKVAVITLAKHVSAEMGFSVGSLLGYKTGLKEKFTKHSKVLYMTDHSLLNEGIRDPLFSKYSCLVIDEAHERSIHTDILLAIIKKCLPQRHDLKIVITSATIDPSVFQQFFQVNECPVIKVPGHAYPVEVKWNTVGVPECPMTRDYVYDAVEIATSIHKTEPPGDILVFLTSAAEIERACLNCAQLQGTAVVLPLHGKLQPDQQQKVFKNYKGCRKIVFATNVAETSVTIPGVKYIVDSGLAKELKFDPKKNMNSLEVSMISKSSAEQRKGRAGRTSAGKCYRMYSEDLYSTMQDMMVPEILRVTLSHMVLKLYEFGMVDILNFDFVEQPNSAALKAAVESLEFLGAVKGNKLTETGNKMCALPIDPHYSKVLLDGIEQGVGLEAATAVAISTLGGSIFFRGGTEEMKMESDRRKVSFCHTAGDQMTYLTAYYQWGSQKHSQQKKWCFDNCINSKSMYIVQETIKELCDTITSKLHMNLNQTANFNDAEIKLPKIFFNAFIQNIGLFLGHERAGYFNEQLADDRLFVFPGSSLCQLNPIPDLVVYEKTLKTSRHFLLQVLPVKEEWIQEAIGDGKLSCHPANSRCYENCRISPITRKNLGMHTCKLFKREQSEFEDHLKSLHPDISTVVFDVSEKKGTLKVFLPVNYHADAIEIMEQHLCKIKDEYKGEQFECGAAQNSDSVRLVLGCGGSIQHVLMPHQFRVVKMVGPVGGDWKEDIKDQLEKSGDVPQVKEKDFKTETCLVITFSDPSDAERVVQSLKIKLPENVSIEPQFICKQQKEAFSPFALHVEWCRRRRAGFAFVSFHNEEDFEIAEECIRTYEQNDIIDLRFRLAKDGKNEFFVSGPSFSCPERDDKNIQSIRAAIPNVPVERLKIVFGHERKFETSTEQLSQLKEDLNALVLKTSTPGQYTLHLSRPEAHYCTYRAYVNFQKLDEGQATLTALQSETIQGKALTVTPKLFSSFRYSPPAYAVIKEPLDGIRQQLQDCYKTSVTFSDTQRDNRENVIFEIHSNSFSAFIAATNALNVVLHPVTVSRPNCAVFNEYLQTCACEEELKQIAASTCTYIHRDLRDMNIKVYGAKAQSKKARKKLKKRLNHLDETMKYTDIKLKGPGLPQGLMKYFVSVFGHDLKGLVNEQKGITVARINPRKHILTLFGTEEGHQSVLQLITSFSAHSDPQAQVTQVHPSQEDIVECCICLTAIEDLRNTFRPEYCGHFYCIDCVQMQVAPSAIKFPVVCEADDCSQPFVWKDFETLFQRTSFHHRELANASLKCYVGANPTLVRNCPTPDCNSIYSVSKDGKRSHCSECNACTCTKCHVPYHYGVTCKLYQSGIKPGSEFEEWLKQDPVTRKCCPQCTAPIEKNEGCNHVWCRKCDAHICWVCQKHFHRSQSCYAHLQHAHGGFF